MRNMIPSPNDTLSEVFEFRAFPGTRKQISQYMRSFKGRYSSESNFVRAALMKYFRELDKELFVKKHKVKR